MFKKEKKSYHEKWLDERCDSIRNMRAIPVTCCEDDRENTILREAVYKLHDENTMLWEKLFEKDREICRLNKLNQLRYDDGECLKNRIKELENERDNAFADIRCLKKKVEELEEQVGAIRPGDYVTVVAPKYHFDREGDIMRVHSVSPDGLCIIVRNRDIARPDYSYPLDYTWTYTKQRVVKIHSDVDARYKLNKIKKILGEE